MNGYKKQINKKGIIVSRYPVRSFQVKKLWNGIISILEGTPRGLEDPEE